MAVINITAAGDTNIDTQTWQLADSFSVFKDARLVIDTEPHIKNVRHMVGVAGQDYGASILVDGRNIKHISVSTTAGLTYGSTITGGTSGATGYFIRTNGTNIIKYRKISGDFVSGETITASGFSGTTTSVPRVGYINVIVKQGTTWQPYSGGKIETQGAWFEIGSTNGTTTLSLGEYDNRCYIPCLWIETTAGSGVYEKWLNKAPNLPWTDFGNGEIHGQWFTHTPTLTSVTFGNNTNGKTPETGRKVRIPNVIFTPGHLTTNGTVNYTGTWPTMTLPNFGDLNLNYLNNAGMYINITQATSVTMKQSCYAYTWSFTKVVGNVTIEDFAYVKEPVNYGTFNYNFMSYLSGTTSIKDSVFHGPQGYALAIQQSNIVNLENVRGVGTGGAIDATQVNEFNALNCRVDLKDDFGYGYFGVTNTKKATITNLKFNGVLNNALSTIQSYMFQIQHSSAVIINPSILGGGGVAHLVFCSAGASNVTVKDIGTEASPVNMVNANMKLIQANNTTNDVVLANIHVTNLNTAPIDVTPYEAKYITIQNCSKNGSDVSVASYCQGLNFKGFQGANLAVVNTFNNDAIGAPDMITYDVFNVAGNAGRIGVLFQKQVNRSIFSVVAGTPFFSDVGDLYMPTLNDEVHITWDYFIKGHSSLQNVAATIRTSTASATPASTNITAYYDIDNGSGFSGTWKLATGANLSGETINVAGFKPKFKLVTTTANAGNLISIFYISTTTTQSAINANQYPIRPTIATVTISPVVDNSEVRIYAAGTQTDIAGIENTSGGSFSYTYEHTADFNVDIQVMHNNYEYIKIFNVTLTDTDSTIPIQQVPDNLYFNP